MKYVPGLLLLAITINGFGQQLTKPNSVQLELGGHGFYYSFNYERVILNGGRFKTLAQAGIAYYPPATGVIELWLPVLVNELISFGHHHLELGGGYILTNEKVNVIVKGEVKERIDGFITGRVGYRHQKQDKKLFYRLAFTPVIEYRNQWELYPMGGAAIGFTF